MLRDRSILRPPYYKSIGGNYQVIRLAVAFLHSAAYVDTFTHRMFVKCVKNSVCLFTRAYLLSCVVARYDVSVGSSLDDTLRQQRRQVEVQVDVVGVYARAHLRHAVIAHHDKVHLAAAPLSLSHRTSDVHVGGNLSLNHRHLQLPHTRRDVNRSLSPSNDLTLPLSAAMSYGRTNTYANC